MCAGCGWRTAASGWSSLRTLANLIDSAELAVSATPTGLAVAADLAAVAAAATPLQGNPNKSPH